MENPDNFNNVRYILSQYIERIDVSNESVSVTFKVAAFSKSDSVSLSEITHIDRSSLNKDYKLVEKNSKLCSKLDKFYKLHREE